MKQVILLSFFTLTLISAYGQIPVPIDSIYNTIKRSSIHAKNSDWSSIDKGFDQKLSVAKNDLDSLDAFVYVFEQLNDYHSGISFKGKYFSNFPSYPDSVYAYIRPLFNLSAERLGVFSAKQLDDQYLYLQVPGVQAMGEDVSKYAQMLSDTLANFASTTTRGIILDLRLNGGGQLSSMVAGIAPLLGNTSIGGGINVDSVQNMEMKIRDGNLFLNNYQVTSISHKSTLKLDQIPVAILIGPTTASSGSILAISFKGRPNTIFIGENTAYGYTTANDFFLFGSTLYLNLSTTYAMDRNNQVYPDVVSPDLVLKGEDNFQSITEDAKVKTALSWLRGNSK